MEDKKTVAFFVLGDILAIALIIVVAVFVINSAKYPSTIFNNPYASTSKVGMSAEYLGTVERKLPEISNEGLVKYPVYGSTLSTTTEEKQAILNENSKLTASSSTYDSMDEEGNLYLNGNKIDDLKLYKHTASIGMYEGNVDDDEPALIKRLTIQSRSGGNHITGLYAPAGEVIKIEVSEEDLKITGGIKIQIGQALTNGQANNIWLERDFNRMPIILNTMTINSTTGYVGSFWGGPIYVSPIKAGATFTVTISGGVAYSHFILGYTSPEEFEMNNQSSAPYFDLEVWDDSVRHSGPKSRVVKYDYDDLYKAAILWDKIARVSNQVPAGSSGDIGITFLYDPFVAAGSMVAFVGRYTVNCPLNCLAPALDYDSAVTNASGNFWGCIHEFNHHYQNYGYTYDPNYGADEVTNNAISILEYSLFTKISANRQLGYSNEGQWSDAWNRFTNPSYTLKTTINKTGRNVDLDGYVNLIHTFGADIYIKATQLGNLAGDRSQQGMELEQYQQKLSEKWFKAVCDASQYNMTYYFTNILGHTISSDIIEQYKDLPIFVPVATIFQTGRSFTYNNTKQYSKTVQPYIISFDKSYTFDLVSNIVIPSDFTFTIKHISKPKHGILNKNTDGTYTYIPDSKYNTSGEIYVTLEISHISNVFSVEDVELVLEFGKGQLNSNLLERTIYAYSQETMYSNLDTAYKNNFDGYINKIKEDNTNRVQNGNAEIWEPSVSKNAIMEISGKIYISQDGKYRIALRGRSYASLYVSQDGKSYVKAATLENLTNSPNFDLTNSNNYSDYTLSKGDWLYFKAYLMVTASNSFIGVGWGRFDGDNVTVSYLNAYRNSYVKEEFDSPYYYTHNYTYNYNKKSSAKQKLVDTNYQQWDNNYPITNIFDDDETNYIHSNKTNITSKNPFELTVDLNQEITANTITIYGAPSRLYLPTTFNIYGGTSLENMKLIKSVENAKITNNNVIVNFNTTTLRYYKIIVTDTSATSTKYIAFRKIEFSYKIPSGKHISPDDNILTYYGDWKIKYTPSTFGHIYEGKNVSLNFQFEGTQLGIFSFASTEYNTFEIYIDGKLIDNINLYNTITLKDLVFISPELENGTHTVVIQSKSYFNIESLVIW